MNLPPKELCKNLGLHLRRNASSELDCVIAEDDLSSDDEPTSPPSGCFLCYRDRNSVYLKFGPSSQKRVTHEKQMLKMASVSGCEVPRDVMSGETVIQEESISYLVLEDVGKPCPKSAPELLRFTRELLRNP